MQTESEGFAPEDGYMPDLVRSLATAGPDRTADLEAQVTMFRERATAAEAENLRLEFELAKVRGELVIAEDALNTAEDELEQAIKLYPTPDEVVVSRQDLFQVLAVAPTSEHYIRTHDRLLALLERPAAGAE